MAVLVLPVRITVLAVIRKSDSSKANLEREALTEIQMQKDAGLNSTSGRRKRELRGFQKFNRGMKALLKDWMLGCAGVSEWWSMVPSLGSWALSELGVP